MTAPPSCPGCKRPPSDGCARVECPSRPPSGAWQPWDRGDGPTPARIPREADDREC